MKRPWLAIDQHFIDDERIVELGDQFGPGAISCFIALLCLTKQAGSGGSVTVGFRSLSRKAFLADANEAKAIIEGAAELGLLEVNGDDPGGGRVRIHFPKWERYQRAPFRGNRDGTVTAPSQDRDPTKTTTKTKTTTEPNTDEQLVENPVPPSLQPLVATFNRVVDAKRARPLKLAVWAKCAEKFADRDLPLEAEKFEHYWLHGAGQNRSLRDVAGAWRNWLRNAPPAGVKPFAGNRYSATERAAELFSRGGAVDVSATEIAG